MKSINHPLLCAAVLLAVSAPALAQQSVEQFIGDGLRKAGLTDAAIADGTYINRLGSRDLPHGLKLEAAVVGPTRPADNAVNKATLAVVVRNPTTNRWCVRPKGQVFEGAFSRWGVTGHNFIIEPGQTINMMWGDVVLDANGKYNVSVSTNVAVWQPNMSAPFESQCKSVAPPNLQAWLQSPDESDLFRPD